MSTVNVIQSGKTKRLDFTKNPDNFVMPDFLSVQLNSYKKFIEEDIADSFKEFFPVENIEKDYEVDVIKYELCLEEIKYSIEECKKRGLNYEAPLKAKVRLDNRKDDEIIIEDVTICNLPVMTPKGTFIINGSEKVVINQIVRSPGCYYSYTVDNKGTKNFSGQIIPMRGAWIEFEQKNNILYVKIDKKNRIPITTLLKVLGMEYPYQIFEKYGNSSIIMETLTKDKAENINDAYLILFSILKPNNPLIANVAKSYIDDLFYNEKKYILEKPGRYKFNKKLDLEGRITGAVLAKDVISQITGETIYYAGQYITRDIANKIQDSGCETVTINKDGRIIKVVSNRMVNITAFGKQFESLNLKEKVYFPAMMKIMEFGREEQIEIVKKSLKTPYYNLIPMGLTKDDILAAIGYILNLIEGVGTVDNIDHLSNRRIRSVGELVNGYFKRGLNELKGNITDSLMRLNTEEITSRRLFNTKVINSTFKEFFNSDQRVQSVDQDNPLAEMSHKNRITAEGIGGIKAERAGFEIRDISNSHYGRMCPVETPEGQKIGVVTNLASCIKINEYGFIEAPYRKVDKSDPENPVVTDEIIYLNAADEEKYIIAQACERIDKDGHFINSNVLCHNGEIIGEFNKKDVDLVDVSPKMMFSITANMIPFLQNDDANRALMGSSMMKQAVPLLFNEPSVVSTGVDSKIARDSRECIITDMDGTVESVDSSRIIIRDDKDNIKEYNLYKSQVSTSNEMMIQRPNVVCGEKVKKGDVIADGPAIKNGELALGQNPLIGFMEWEGYNYEDAVLISERLVKEDVYTSLHIFDFAVETREIDKCGVEEITADMPGYSAYETRNLDEDGIVRIGAYVEEGDILVGKVTPKNPEQQDNDTIEDKLLNIIFGKKQRKVKNTPLKVPHGMYGTVIGYERYSKDKGDSLSNGVYEKVVVYIAQKRKIQVGDKMAGRHGNKGVVSRVLPVEDMPYLENGKPLDIVLNPLGVPSRMNIGQILELHLGLASGILGIKSLSPIFNGADESDINMTATIAKDYINLEADEFKKKYKKTLSKDVMNELSEENRKAWAGVEIQDGFKMNVYDGRTGEMLPKPISVGYMHYMKLHHMVDDKIYARSTGSYSIVTQQPPGGKSHHGGQRIGEMETWAIEAHGASTVLQEMLTIKSDDVAGRTKAYKAIIEGETLPIPNVPETFRVLVKTLQGLGINVTMYDGMCNEIGMDAELINLNVNKFIENNYGFEQTKNEVEEDAHIDNGYQMGFADSDDYNSIDEMFDDEED